METVKKGDLKIEDSLKCAVIKSAFCLQRFLLVVDRVTVTNLRIYTRTCMDYVAFLLLCVQKPQYVLSQGMKCKLLRANLLDDVLFNELPSFGALPSLPYVAFVNLLLAHILPG